MLTDDEIRELRAGCDRSLNSHGPVRVADALASIPVETEPDRYGAGGVVTELEEHVAGLLGKPAAVFVPSGTMAQQIVLRVHAERRARRTVLYHPTCHLRLHENGALERVQRLIGRPVGTPERLLTLDDLEQVAEPPAVLLVELPQREIGGQQPPLDQLDAQLDWARSRGAATHLDGARIWESAAGYGVPPAELAARFDTAYVSFYKGIGALPGCCLVGPADVIAEAREWRHRMGGTLFGLWPNAASALSCLRERLPRMPAYLDRAREIAAALRAVDGVTVVPDPPRTAMMHLLLRCDETAFEAAARALAIEHRLLTWLAPTATLDPRVQKVELSVGDATMALTVDDVCAAVARFVAD